MGWIPPPNEELEFSWKSFVRGKRFNKIILPKNKEEYLEFIYSDLLPCLTKRWNNGWKGLSKAKIAKIYAVSRPTLNAALKQWEEEN